MAEPAPLLATAAAPVPAGAAATWFRGSRGLRLRAALFPATGTPRGSVILSGGRTEPIEKYFEVARELTARGFVVLAHDWRGQGLSARLAADPMKGHARGYRDFLVDYRCLLDAFEDRLPKPWLAVSHSMGGCLTALALAKGERRIEGAVLTAPMFGLHLGGLPPWLAGLLAGGLTRVGLGLGGPGGEHAAPPAPFEDNILTHDPARYARNVEQVLQHPELSLGPPTWSWIDFAMSAIADLQRGPDITHVAVPVTVLAAGDDKIADNAGLRLVTSRMPKGRYVEIPGASHEILQETDVLRAPFWTAFDALAGGAAA
jgi:lysophospholipase